MNPERRVRAPGLQLRTVVCCRPRALTRRKLDPRFMGSENDWFSEPITEADGTVETAPDEGDENYFRSHFGVNVERHVIKHI